MMTRKKHQTIRLLDYAAVADRTGIEVGVLRSHAERGKMPEPDYRLGQSPGWLPETIEEWVATFTPAGLPPARKRVG